MPNTKTFEPIKTAEKIAESYRDYIASTIHFDDGDLQAQLECLLSREGYLAKGPFLQAAPPYTKAKSVRKLIEAGVLCRGMLKLGDGDPRKFDPDRPLYQHQVEAIRKAIAGRNYAVVTGTGSGKTECFLLPILNDILREDESGDLGPGVRAILLYPMNALANDQVKRLRELVEGTPITFGRYTGDTEESAAKALAKWNEENPNAKKLQNEIISREEIRANPPHILLTNYSMLEYLLLRPEDTPLFGEVFGSRWRHIAVDEAHVYSGALGTEVAFLLRRLKARIASETGKAPKLHCYATSATIGSDEDKPLVAKFAQDLFGEEFEGEGADIDVITSSKDLPEDALDSETWGTLPLVSWRELRRELLNLDDPKLGLRIESVLAPVVPPAIMDRLEKAPTVLLGLGRALLGEKSTATLVRRASKDLIDLTDIEEIDRLGIDELSHDAEGIETLTAMVEVLSVAQRSEDVPILSSRYHSFLRAPEGLYINLVTRRLTAEKTLSVPYGESNENTIPVYEVSVCRHCGQAYVLGAEENGIFGEGPWLSPKRGDTDMDDDFVPREYYRLVPDGEDLDEGEELRWLCPVCGSLHSEADSGHHRFEHEGVSRVRMALGKATEDDAKCGHCGYRHRYAIQPMRVSPESAGSVICYDLVREVPSFKKHEETEFDNPFDSFEADEEKRAGSVICFSDKRQDAAFFAPSMERTYDSITRRQIIREAVDSKSQENEGCTPASAVSWIAGSLEGKYSVLLGDSDSGELAEAWILDELSSQAQRMSLDGVGTIRVEPTKVLERLSEDAARSVVQKCVSQLKASGGFNWLDGDDYRFLCSYCLDDLRIEGAVSQHTGIKGLRGNKGQPVTVSLRPDSARDRCLNFVGSSSKTENRRSRFIRKYAMKTHGAEMSREDSTTLLASIGQFLENFLSSGLFPKGTLAPGPTGRGSFTVNKNVWRFYPQKLDDRVFVCDTCGCSTHVNTNGVCPTNRCQGILVATTYRNSYHKDRFYKDVYHDEALPLRIEEHTAQLSHKQAREIQSKFLQGDVNVLSCTTTFELGVDVGDLRAIFMRNVPPSTANYTQRAGRVGRRAGMPGYAVTFCRLRPHDVAFFKNPRQMIDGVAPVPTCYLDNIQIALRHVFAVALSEFFRLEAAAGKDYAHKYNNFLSLKDSDPEGLELLKDYLAEKPRPVRNQIESVFSGLPKAANELGVDGWGWVDDLVGSGDEGEGKKIGRLVRTHQLKHADYKRVLDEVEATSESGKKRGLYGTLESLEKEGTISILAGAGVLPKYGFPTDIVELRLFQNESVEDNRLQLQRGLRQAIHEYAPGAEVVAGKQLWRSRGVKLVRGQKLITRGFGHCKDCDTYVWPISVDSKTDTELCPVCKREICLNEHMLVPSFGFEGERVQKGLVNERPRAHGYTLIRFSQRWPNEVRSTAVEFTGGYVETRSASNARLCAINPNRSRGFWICSYCGAASGNQGNVPHWSYCRKYAQNPEVKHYNALGTDFTSDVLELRFAIPTLQAGSEEWESTMWAIHAAAVQLLQVPASEIGGTCYKNAEGSHSVMIYDNVPGGAGRAQQLNRMLSELLRKAYYIVDGCSCSEDTCCYGCIANYYNQGRQEALSRGAAKRILGALLGDDTRGVDPQPATEIPNVISNEVSKGTPVVRDKDTASKVTSCKDARDAETTTHGDATPLNLTALFDGPSLEGYTFGQACRCAETLCRNEAERRFIEELAEAGEEEPYELPQIEVTFRDSKGSEAEAMLAWEGHHIAVLSESDIREFKSEFGSSATRIAGWTVFFASEDDPIDALEKLAE